MCAKRPTIMAWFPLALTLLGVLTLAQDPDKKDEPPEPSCDGDIPLYLRWPSTYLYHLEYDEALITLLSSPFPKIDDRWYKERWTAQEVPEENVIRWVARDAQGGSDLRGSEGDQSGWRHVPGETSLVSYAMKMQYVADGQAIHNSVLRLEKMLSEFNVTVSRDSSSYSHQNHFLVTKKQSIAMSHAAHIMEAAAEHLVQDHHVELEDIQLVEEKKICKELGNAQHTATCLPEFPYRNPDGTCNNLANPNFGKALTPFRRMFPPQYGQSGVAAPRASKNGSPLTSARRVSVALKAFPRRFSDCFSIFQMSFGQFIDHELTSTPTAKGDNGTAITCCHRRVLQELTFKHPECFPILIDVDDPFYSAYGQTCMEFVRSLPAPTCRFGPREQLNQVTAYLDGSAVYGSSRGETVDLRTLKNGLLKTFKTKNGDELLPILENDHECSEDNQKEGKFCFKSGDARVNEHLLLTFITTLFAKEHNRIARELSKLWPAWNDEVVFQEAKRIVVASIQHITYNEFLSGLLSPLLVNELNLKPLKDDEFYKGYDPTVDAGIANEFSTSAFRMGHSMIPDMLIEKKASGEYSAKSMNKVIFSPSQMYNEDGLASVMHGALAQSIETVDKGFSQEISNMLFKRKKEHGLDLVAINIQRGRDHGLPGYIVARKECGFPPVRSFHDLNTIFDPEVVFMLRDLYRHPEDIDLFVGGMSERALPGGLVGPTFACIISDQFLRLKRGDRFWYENEGQVGSFTPAQLRVLHQVSLARVMCDNFPAVGRVQRWPLQLAGRQNPVISCDSPCLPKLDLSPWAP